MFKKPESPRPEPPQSPDVSVAERILEEVSTVEDSSITEEIPPESAASASVSRTEGSTPKNGIVVTVTHKEVKIL